MHDCYRNSPAALRAAVRLAALLTLLVCVCAQVRAADEEAVTIPVTIHGVYVWLSVCWLGELSERAPGTKVRLKLRAGDGTVRDVTLTLRDLL